MSDVVSPAPVPASAARPTGPIRRGWAVIYPSISARITAPFLLIIIVVAAIGVFVVTHLVAGSIQERFNNQLVSSADAASNSLVDLERQLLATLRLMTFTEGVPQAISARDGGSLDQWLRPVAANANLDRLVVFDRAGAALLSLGRVGSDSAQYEVIPVPDVSAWAGAQQVLLATADALGDKFVDVISTPTDYLLYVSAPVFDGDQLQGGVSVGITFDRVARRAGEQALSAVTLYAADGAVLGSTFVSPPPNLVLDVPTAARLATAAQSASPVEEVVLNGESYQVMYAPLDMRSRAIGLLAVALPSRFLVERSSTSRDLFGVLFVVMFLIVSVSGLMIGRTITRPVAQLVETTRLIRGGDLSRRVGLRSPDELGELSVSFDHMTDQLVERNEEINQLYQAQLQETARREAVLSSISDAVLVQNLSGRIILKNPTAELLLEQVRQNPRTRQEFTQMCGQPAELVEPRTVQLVGKTFSLLATPVSMPDGDALGHVIVFRDITALMETERLKDEMILQLSHELRTPLTAARGYMELMQMLEQQRLSAQGQDFVTNVSGNLLTLERMVNQVIDVSAIITHHFALEIERVNLSEILQERIQHWRPLFDQRELALSFAPPSAIYVDGDARRLAQVIDHLAHNAYSYTLPGGMVKLDARTNGVQAVVSLLDSGVGIGAEEINQVFERMYRGRSAEAGPTDARGLGLGLYLAKYIVEAHGGSIQLESQIDVGTIATVYLPLAAKEQ